MFLFLHLVCSQPDDLLSDQKNILRDLCVCSMLNSSDFVDFCKIFKTIATITNRSKYYYGDILKYFAILKFCGKPGAVIVRPQVKYKM